MNWGIFENLVGLQCELYLFIVGKLIEIGEAWEDQYDGVDSNDKEFLKLRNRYYDLVDEIRETGMITPLFYSKKIKPFINDFEKRMKRLKEKEGLS